MRKRGRGPEKKNDKTLPTTTDDDKFLPSNIFAKSKEGSTGLTFGFELHANASKSMFNYPTVNTAC